MIAGAIAGIGTLGRNGIQMILQDKSTTSKVGWLHGEFSVWHR